VERLDQKPFALVGVATEIDPAALTEMNIGYAGSKLNWRSFWNGPGGIRTGIAQTWGVTQNQTAFLINERGIIRRCFRQEMDVVRRSYHRGVDLDHIIDDIVAEAEKGKGRKTNGK